jgi:XTP/dITP diphosphohydrolase
VTAIRTGTLRVVLASRNEDKLVELRRILGAAGLAVELIGLPPGEEVAETGATFEENALIKARDAVRVTGLPAVADDSGLAVDALNGMPGILSARWSGRYELDRVGRDEANNDLLLRQMADTPDRRRGAAFVCAAALVTPTGVERVVRGELRGVIVREPRGANGFGYDPLFVADGNDRTNGELSAAEKDAISHRGKAFTAMAALLGETELAAR